MCSGREESRPGLPPGLPPRPVPHALPRFPFPLRKAARRTRPPFRTKIICAKRKEAPLRSAVNLGGAGLGRPWCRRFPRLHRFSFRISLRAGSPGPSCPLTNAPACTPPHTRVFHRISYFDTAYTARIFKPCGGRCAADGFSNPRVGPDTAARKLRAHKGRQTPGRVRSPGRGTAVGSRCAEDPRPPVRKKPLPQTAAQRRLHEPHL